MQTESAGKKKRKKRSKSPTFGAVEGQQLPRSLSLKNESKSATQDDSDFSSGGTSDESSNTPSDIEDYGLKLFNVDQNEIQPLEKQ